MDLAARQQGVVSRRQALAAGLSPRALEHRLVTGRFTRLHRGVYLLGPIRAPLTDHVAALLACGPGAVISHRSAAALFELPVAPRSHLDVTVPARDGRTRRPGIRVHRPSVLPAADVTTRDDLPTTTPTRTVLDLAAHVPERELLRVVEEAERRGLVDRVQLARRLAGIRGAATLREVLRRFDAPQVTRSEAERRMLDLVRAAALPRPSTNTRIGRYEVDLLWQAQRLVVEIDGYAFHGTRAAFERDRRRDVELAEQGYRVLRFTWRQIVGEPEWVIARLAAAMAVR